MMENYSPSDGFSLRNSNCLSEYDLALKLGRVINYLVINLPVNSDLTFDDNKIPLFSNIELFARKTFQSAAFH